MRFESAKSPRLKPLHDVDRDGELKLASTPRLSTLKLASTPWVLALAMLLMVGCGVGVVGSTVESGGGQVMGAPETDPRYVTVIPAGLPHATATFTDDFQKGYLDQTKWSNSYELTGTFDGDRNIWTTGGFDFIPGGGIRMRADARATPAPTAHPTLAKSYTGVSMTTYGSFWQAYGYFEMKARMPSGSGLYPAFWMLAQNVGTYPPEIDILEGQEADPTYQDNGWFYDNPANNNKTTDVFNPYSGGTNWSLDYHTYGLAWQPGQLIFYIDGVAHWTQNSPYIPSDPTYIILTDGVAIFGGAPVVGTSQFPGYMDVLYVHAYQFDGMPAGNPIPFTWNKTTISQQTINAGDSVTLTSSVLNGAAVSTGPTAALGPHINFIVKDYFNDGNSTIYSNSAIDVPAPLQPGQVYPLTKTFVTPTTMPRGIYNFQMSACVNVGCASHSPFTPGGAPTRFLVVPDPLLNLSSMNLTPVRGKPYSGTVNYSNGGKSVTTAGNMWLSAPLSYTVTPSTMIELDLTATGNADAYAIGLFPGANYADAVAQTFLFQFGGAKPLGIQSFDHYANGDGTTHYMIPVGDYYTGKMANLVLLSTDATNAAANATIGNVRIYEGP